MCIRDSDTPVCVLRLAAPLLHTALMVPAEVRMESMAADLPTMVDPTALVARLEAEIHSPVPVSAEPGRSDPPMAAEG